MPKSFLLSLIVISQFCCTSLWFAGNAILPQLVKVFDLSSQALGHLTAAVQLGFILGTLVFALLNIADRFAPSKVFFLCSVAGAFTGLEMLWTGNSLFSLIFFRVLTGFFLAGIYPVGMKIASDHFDSGLGTSLGFLVGALVLGTAFPHALAQFNTWISWEQVVWITSGLSIGGGALMFFGVPKGPYRKVSFKLDFGAVPRLFREPGFRSAAFGYFGHMWELYAFWAFVPFMLNNYLDLHPLHSIHVSFWAFIVIASGSLGCILAGFLARHWGPKRIASAALMLSGICCLLSPFSILQSSFWVYISFLIFWGVVVVADSPLFSTLVAKNAPAHLKGTGLTIVNCLGFAITIISIQLLTWIQPFIQPYYLFLLLALGPIVGLMGFLKNKGNRILSRTLG
ncbi:MAG: MFS transporter [Luteibaculum sp.]